MDQATRLYVLTPVFNQISRLCGLVWSMVGCCAVYLSEEPSNEDLSATLDCFFEGNESHRSCWSYFRELYLLLKDPRLDAVGYGEDAATFRLSIIVFARPDSPEECQNAAYSLVECHDHFFEWLRKARENEFGFWGNRFLEYISESSPINDLKRFARQYADKDDFYTDSTTPDGFQGSTRAKAPLVIDSKKYRLTFRGVQTCNLGNTKMFHFLRVLADRSEQYLPHSRIVQLMGDDRFDIDQLKVCKRRLCERLEGAYCEEVAKAIKAQRGEYGLFLSENGIALLFIRDETEMQP